MTGTVDITGVFQQLTISIPGYTEFYDNSLANAYNRDGLQLSNGIVVSWAVDNFTSVSPVPSGVNYINTFSQYISGASDDSGDAVNIAFTNMPTLCGYDAIGKPSGWSVGTPSSPPVSPPTAANEPYNTAANTALSIDLTAGSTGSPTSAALVAAPTGGTLTGFPGTTVTFTPTAGYSGTTSFQFTLANAEGTSNTATDTITVQPPPPPTAANESYTTPAKTALTIDLAIGSTGSPASDAVVSEPKGGAVSLISNTTKAIFTPSASFSGTTSFQYNLINSGGTSNTATITINVLPSPPVAVSSKESTKKNTPLTFTLPSSPTGGTPVGSVLVGTPTNGTVTGFSSTSTVVTFTPDKGFSGTAGFQFELSNSGGASNTASISISVGTPTISAASPGFQTTDVTDTTTQAVVGQRITLSATSPDMAGDSYAWDVKGATVGKFTTTCPPSDGYSYCGGPEAPDFTRKSPTFYWYLPGTYDVNYSYTHTDGTPAKATATFQVVGPLAANIQTTLGLTQVLNNTQTSPQTTLPADSEFHYPKGYIISCGYYFETPCIDFNSSADTSNVPPSLGGIPINGTFTWVQLLYENTLIINGSPRPDPHIPSLQYPALDNFFPYSENSETDDSPFFKWLATDTEVTRKFLARMYLMWQPVGLSNSIPVPLGYVVWGFTEKAKSQSGVPALKPSPLPPNVESIVLPNANSLTAFPVWYAVDQNTGS